MAEANGSTIRLPWHIVVQVLGWLVMALLTYAAINARVAVVESRVDGIQDQLSEIRTDVKTLLHRER